MSEDHHRNLCPSKIHGIRRHRAGPCSRSPREKSHLGPIEKARISRQIICNQGRPMEVDLCLNHIKILTLGKRRKHSTLEQRSYMEECTDNLGYPQTYHGPAAQTPKFRPRLETRDPMGSLTIPQALKMIRL